jgi:STAS-like domain of unknown function (DUF4325)
MVIQISRITACADTNLDGAAVLAVLKKLLDDGVCVTVSFAGLQIATSSFVNSAFVPLLDHFSFSHIKENLKIINSTRQINEMIKMRMEQSAIQFA